MLTGALPAFKSVTEYLSWDHDRLDALLESVRSAVERRDWDAARRYFHDFQGGLDRHIRLEEEILFPRFEQSTGRTDPTAVLRREHGRIRAALDLLARALDQGEGREFRVGLASLLTVLPDHNVKEEQVLYPATDAALSEDECRALTTRLQEA